MSLKIINYGKKYVAESKKYGKIKTGAKNESCLKYLCLSMKTLKVQFKTSKSHSFLEKLM